MKINLNASTTVVLTHAGAEVYNTHYAQYPQDIRPASVASGERVTTTLWQIMAIFGPQLTHAGPLLFVNCEVDIDTSWR